MDPKPAYFYLAPGADAGLHYYRMPGARQLPRVDEHLVAPETREEMVRGERMLALPAHPPHGDHHSTLDSVVSPHVVDGYVASTDLLTRFGEGSDFAADVCVRKAGVDTEGVRHLEELAFEVVHTQTRRHMTVRAQEMLQRGVRRVFAIFVNSHTVEEYVDLRWHILDLDAHLSDPVLVRPLLVRALLDAALALNEVVKAAEIKGVPRTREIREEGKLEGKLEGERTGKREGERVGMRRLLESLCETKNIPLTSARRSQLLELDADQLDALFRHLITEQRWPD